MSIRNAKDARVWLRAWGGRPRPGILAAAIDGLELAAGLSNQGEAKKLRAAAQVLRRAVR